MLDDRRTAMSRLFAARAKPILRVAQMPPIFAPGYYSVKHRAGFAFFRLGKTPNSNFFFEH
jgi:hypothetical protein